MARKGGRVPRLPYTNPTFATDIHLLVGTQKEGTKNMNNNLLGHKRLPACYTGALYTIQARQPHPCQSHYLYKTYNIRKGIPTYHHNQPIEIPVNPCYEPIADDILRISPTVLLHRPLLGNTTCPPRVEADVPSMLRT